MGMDPTPLFARSAKRPHSHFRCRQDIDPCASSWVHLLPACSRIASLINDSVLIGIADTLLHVTTETRNFDQITANLDPMTYGRQIPGNCALGSMNGTRVTCAIVVPPNSSQLDYLINPSEVYDVLSDQSYNNNVSTALYQGQRLSYLAPSSPASTLDFKATTIGSRSECQSARQQCHANSTNYHCSSLFNTTTATKGWYLSKSSGNIINLGIFPNSDLINASYTSLPNPFHTITQILIYAGNNPGPGVDTIQLPDGGREFFLRCTTSFFNVTYTSVNSTIAIQNATLITDQNIIYSLAEINVQGRSGYVDGQILGGALTAFHQNTSAKANEAFASQYDATFLAAAASIAETVPNLEEQTRTTIIATLVHKSALLALILTLLISAVFGMLMVLLALSTSRSATGPTQDQGPTPQPDESRLPPPSIEDVFEEYVDAARTDRLGVFRTKQGTWEYVCQTPESKTLGETDTGPPSTPAQETPKEPGETLGGQGLGLFGIPLVQLGSPGKSLSVSVSELSDDEKPNVPSSGKEGLSRGSYHAL